MGFVPALKHPYNFCRSDIKPVEMSSRGVLPILPSLTPYHEFLKKTELPSYGTLREMKELIVSYLKDRTKLKEASLRCYNYVSHERLSHQRRERLDLLLSVMTEKRSEYPWPYAKGYFEVRGHASSQIPFREILIRAQSFFNQRQRLEGLRLIEKSIEENPLNPEFAWHGLIK